jgi:hypothetical protein
VHEQEFVVGGWTEPRQTRSYFGALLLGVYDEKTGALTYVGHTGTGFDQAELERVSKLLKARATRQSPFSPEPKTNESPHWVRPDLVAQVRFTEWTADAKLRHPVYLGLRDDKAARDVRREESKGSDRGQTGVRPGVRPGQTRVDHDRPVPAVAAPASWILPCQPWWRNCALWRMRGATARSSFRTVPVSA